MVSDRLHIPRRVLAGAFGLAVLGVCGLGLHALAGAQEARSREAAPRAQATIRPNFRMPQFHNDSSWHAVEQTMRNKGTQCV